jgi:hypothetical protein
MTKVTWSVLRQKFFTLVILPTLVLLALTFVLMNWHLPTPVELRLTTSKVDFVLKGGPAVTPILNQVKGESFAFTKFGTLTFSPRSLEVANPNQYDIKNDKYPDTAWRPIAIDASQVTISANDEILNPTINLEAIDRESYPLLGLDNVLAKRGSLITLEVLDKTVDEGNEEVKSDDHQTSAKVDLSIKIRQPGTSETVTSRGLTEITASYCQLRGSSSSPYSDRQTVTYKTQLSAANPFFEVTDKAGKMSMLLRLPAEQTSTLFYDGVIPVIGVRFILDDSQTHNLKTALVRGVDATISYPGRNREASSFKAPDFVELGEQDQFFIKEITLDSKHKGLGLHLIGQADKLRVGIPGISMDLRNTAFDVIWQNKYLAIIFTIICWLGPAVLSVRSAYNELDTY